MNSTLRKSLATLMAVLLVSTAGFAPVGTAAAASDGDCAEQAFDASMEANWGPMPDYYAMVGTGVDCFFGDDSAEQLAETDAAETRVNVYQTAANTRASGEQTTDTLSNYAQDGVEVALMDGKMAYIRAIDNGSSQTAANSTGIEAIQDWAAGRQMRLLNQYSISSEAMAAEIQEVENDSNLNKDFINTDSGVFDMSSSSGTFSSTANTYSVTLANGSTHNVSAVASSSDGTDVPYHPLSSESLRVWVNPFGDYTSDQTFINLNDWKQANQEIVNAKDSAITRLKTFSANTYPSVESGEINTSELIDPYLVSRNYATENASFGSFTMRTMQQLGYGSPSNLSETKEMTVLHGSQATDGILLSDGLPANGSFNVGQTYNATALAGKQYVASDSGLTEITGDFSISEVRDVDGNVSDQESVAYRNVSYQSTNLTEFRSTMDDVSRALAEIETRQQNLRNTTSSGGSGLFGDVNPTTAGAVALVALALLALMVAGRDDGHSVTERRN